MAREFVFEDTKRHDYRYIRQGLLRRGWKQISLPRRAQPTPKPDRNSSWVFHEGGMGVSCVGRKEVTCPDLIWTLSCGRSPGLSTLAPHQATNFFGASSACLTTKAGLCRTLQGTGFWSSDKRHENVGPESFFPRCFDLSDSSQLEDLKENFRQTAAAVVLKVFCRLSAESRSRAASEFSADKPVQLNVGEVDPMHHAPSQEFGSVEGWGVKCCQGHVHPWALALAVRACRRRLLEMSGWREDHTGHNEGKAPSDANGAESLTDREWEALLAYSYSLRKVAVGATSLVHGQLSDDGRGSEELEEHGWGHPAGVGLRGARGLRGTRTGKVPSKSARRPSSAPVERRHDEVLSRRRQRLSRRSTAANDAAFSPADCARACRSTAPASWGVAEACGFRGKSLPGVRSPARDGQSPGCACLHDVIGQQEWERGYMSGLALEANQLCAAFERRCPQWMIDGERNLWVLKPAGASRGQGVRVAWTLDQILCAQKTMGGRVAQKYVEAPLLLPRGSRTPRRLSNGSVCLGGGVHRRRRLKLRLGSFDGRQTQGHECAPETQRWREEEKSGAHGPDAWKAGKTCRDHPETVEKEPIVSGGEAGLLPGRSEEGHTHSCAGDTEHEDIDAVESAGERKFDIRTWALVTGWDPLEAFVFDESYLRVCPENFTLDESKFSEPQVHLTNLSARRRNTKRTTKAWDGQARRQDGEQRRRRPWSSSAAAFREANRGIDGVRQPTETAAGEVETAGFVASQAELIQRLGETDEEENGGGVNRRGQEEVRARGERLWRTKVSPSIDGVVRTTLLAAGPHMRPRAPSFQLFGFDLILDRQLRPWLLEVNLSPALSHCSRHQSATISSMCEGLLRLTVDRIFPAPPSPPPASNVLGADDTSLDSNPSTPATHASGPSSRGEPQGQRARHTGAWRPIAGTSSSPSASRSHEQDQPETRSSPPDALGVVRNPSAQVFSLSGRRLTRRSLARAERGVREASAVKVLAAWWRSKADECREARSRRLRATARVSAWAMKTVARRRRKACLLRSESERSSARVIQARWRRAAEARRLAARAAACVVVQTAWRRRKCDRRCASRRVRRHVSSGLQRWARSILSRRQNLARKTILRAVTAAVTRHAASKRHAAAAAAAVIIRRELETTCNRRRQSRLRLQRFARTPCLLRVRLAALSLARVDRVRSEAAAILARTFRRASRRSATVRAAFAARTIQSWYRTLPWGRGERRRASVVTIQQAWRQRRMVRRLLAEAEQPPRKSAVETVASATLTPPSVPACAVDPGNLVAVGGAAVLDASGSKTGVGVLLAGHSYASGCSRPDRSVEGNKMLHVHSLRVPVDGEGDQSISPATTARENWSDPDLCLAGGGAQSCRSLVSEDGSSSHNDTFFSTVVTARGPSPLSGTSTPRTGRREAGKAAAATSDGSRGGLLDLEDILPDVLERRRRNAPSDGTTSKQHRCSKDSNPTSQAKGNRCRPIADRSPRGFGDGRATPAFRSLDGGLPYPPAGGTQPIVDTRAQQQWIARRPVRAKGGERRGDGVASKPAAPETSGQRNRRAEVTAGHSRCRSRPISSGCRSRCAPKGDGHDSSLGWNGTARPVKEVYAGPTGAKSGRSRVGPSSRRAGARNGARGGVGVRGARYSGSLGSSVRWKGESGGVLEMLACMDA